MIHYHGGPIWPESAAAKIWKNRDVERLVDAVIGAAVAMGKHPHIVTIHLCSMVVDEKEQSELANAVYSELSKRAVALPWVLYRQCPVLNFQPDEYKRPRKVAIKWWRWRVVVFLG